ncbi:MAG: hypothetical protein NZM04_05850 [Methylacidiphilales bacterium]|nr:hypothetical protein [Candidatus Methylacidiphilales bacterium]MDW8350060.1 hypothetical protein [Verrucomicrobiae bacterium]
MSEFVTHMFISFAMGEWKQIRDMAQEVDSETYKATSPLHGTTAPMHSEVKIRDILERPTKEPIFAS